MTTHITPCLNEFLFRFEIVDHGLGVAVKRLQPFPHRDFVVVGAAAGFRPMPHPLQHLLVVEHVGDAAGAAPNFRLESHRLILLARIAVQQKPRRAHHGVPFLGSWSEKGEGRGESGIIEDSFRSKGQSGGGAKGEETWCCRNYCTSLTSLTSLSNLIMEF